MNGQQSTSISGKAAPENARGEGAATTALALGNVGGQVFRNF
jgi:hypothetical protein